MDYSVSTHLYNLIVLNIPKIKRSDRMITIKQTIISWLFLIILTLASVFVGKVLDNNVIFITSVLLIVFLKGQQITDIFMELKDAPRMWRLLLLGYVFIIPSVICVIYLL